MKATFATMLIIGVFLFAPPAGAKPAVTVVFRFDDYSAGFPTDAALRILMAFDKRDIPVCFSVIPFAFAPYPPTPGQEDRGRLTEEKAWILRKMVEDGTLEVADHGLSHEDLSQGGPTGATEFAGRPYEEQLGRMLRGKQLLDKMLDVPVHIFVPPYNTYDENTVRAAKTAGMRIFSPGGPDDALQKKYHEIFVGCGAGLTNLKERVEKARLSGQRHQVVTAVFHLSDIKDFTPTASFSFAELEELLDWLKVQPDVRVSTIKHAAGIISKRR